MEKVAIYTQFLPQSPSSSSAYSNPFGQDKQAVGLKIWQKGTGDLDRSKSASGCRFCSRSLAILLSASARYLAYMQMHKTPVLTQGVKGKA